MVTGARRAELAYLWRNWRSLRRAIARGRAAPARPSLLQVQTTNRCNGACAMCPYPAERAADPPGRMDEALFRSLADEVSRWPEGGVLAMTLQNEPFLDPRLEDWIDLWRAANGRRWLVEITTNGSLLGDERLARLRASPPDVLNVSLHALDAATSREIAPGLDPAEVGERVLRAARTLEETQVMVRFVKQRRNLAQWRAFKRRWNARGVPVIAIEANDRLGAVRGYDRIGVWDRQPARRAARRLLGRALLGACPLPFSQANVLWDGRVLACCNDYRGETETGSLARAPLAEVFAGPAHAAYRAGFLEGRPHGACATCTLFGRNVWM